ncbi:hypothetical protein DPEC_G00197690, partial [Dallia pectoralis]
EDPENLVKQYVDVDEDDLNKAIEDTTVGIYVFKENASSNEPEDIGIVLQGIKVLQDLDNVALAVAMLFGLMYALNFSYPPGLRCTFEIIQKIFMELDGGTLSNKALVLKKQALPVKGSKRLHCQPNSLVIPEGMYGCTIWINFVCLFDFTGQDLHGTA